MAEHTDLGSLTILSQLSPGLQVKLQSEWMDLEVIPNSFVVNIGNVMQVWTNHQWTSAVHR